MPELSGREVEKVAGLVAAADRGGIQRERHRLTEGELELGPGKADFPPFFQVLGPTV